jgi:hypothetical protein
MKYLEVSTGQTVDLNNGHFKAKGGEGSIYIKNGRVYKICEKDHMIPEGKFTELAVLKHPRIICPESLLLNRKHEPVGYSMKAVPNDPKSLTEILTKSYREREGVTPQHMADLVLQIREGIAFTHNNHILLVDGNENNYMVTSDYKDVYFIDVNAWQTPHYPCLVINPSIRDWHCPKPNCWSELSDWFSFCVVAWWMFTAIHPYKIRHPVMKSIKTSLTDCMIANKSVMDKDAIFPQGAVYYPFESFIPGGRDGAFMQWFRAVLNDGKRLIPPVDYQAILGPIITKVQAIVGSHNFTIKEIHNFGAKIVGYCFQYGKEVVTTKDDIVVNHRPYPKPSQRFRIGVTPQSRVIAASVENERLKLWDVESQSPIAIDARAKSIMTYQGRIYVQYAKIIGEVSFVHSGKVILSTVQPVANIMEHATQLFHGVAFQQMFESHIASVFPQTGQHFQIKIPELDGYRITDAKFERGILMVVGTKGKSGEYDRLVIRFASDWTKYDCRIVEDVPLVGINFTVLDSELCVCITEEDKVELFSAKYGSTTIKTIEDPAIQSDMHLCRTGGVQFVQGNKLFSFSMV